MNKVLEIEDTTNFVVMPPDTNYMDIIFGGFFMAKLDIAAATVVTRAVRFSEICDKAVTHKFEVEFVKPCFVGDIVTIHSRIDYIGRKSIIVKQLAHKETREDATKIIVASSTAIFVTMNGNQFLNHELELI